MFGKQAVGLLAEAKQLAAGDPDWLVRLRADEFLGSTGADDPIEINLILNSMGYLREDAD